MNKVLLALVGAMVVASVSFGADDPHVDAEPGEIDPVEVSPEKFTVLLENEHLRIVEYTLAPGERDAWHTHPPKVSYVLSAGTLRITKEDGTSFLSNTDEGDVSWRGRLGRHYAENVGDTTVRVLLVEVKSATATPSEGETTSTVGAGSR